jgi:CheY-like chemotaxis protein
MTRVLVVDDERDTLDVLRLFLELSGYQPFTTFNSLDAITLAEVERPDCILLDIMMPGLDGFSLCKMMRSHPLIANLPIMFVTAYSPMDLEDRRLEAGADMVLPKPFGMDSLIQSIEQLMATRVAQSVTIAPAQPVQAAPLAPSAPPAQSSPAAAPDNPSQVIQQGAAPDAYTAAFQKIIANRSHYI